MKLTKYMKEGIARAIIADIPERDDAIIQTELQAAAVAAMSPEVAQLYRTHPGALKVESVYLNTAFRRFYVTVGDIDHQKLFDPYEAVDNERNMTKGRLKEAIMSCSTLKQLQAMFPEFIKYMPTEDEPTKNLPALANVVADLVKMGWPKGA